MKTLYSLSILACLVAIILLLWRILHKEAGTPVTNVTPPEWQASANDDTEQVFEWIKAKKEGKAINRLERV